MEYRHVRCLFCNTSKETQVVHSIQENGWGRAIFPQRIKTVMKGGSWINIADPLLPGYVFVYSNEAEDQHAEYQSLESVIRVLTYGDRPETLKGRDLEFAGWLWDMQGKIGVMEAVQVNDRIEIIDGVFKKLHGTITKMDRRRRTIRVSLETEGAPKQIWLAYDVVEKR